MFRKPPTVNSVALGVEEIKQNFYINKRFGGIVERLKTQCQNPYEYEEEVAKVFKELVTYIDKRYYNISDMESRESVLVPKTIQEFNLIYKLKHPTRQSSLHGFTKDIKCVNGIHSATINSVIHSSMCCGKDRTSWAYQLFRVYQQYPETLLRSAMTKIRTDQMVSIKKSYMCAMKKYGNCMPMSSSQYQLSTGYIYKFQTKWPYEIFNEAHQMLCKFSRWQHDNQSEDLNHAVPDDVDGMETGPVTGGLVVGIHDYLARGQLDFDIEIPDQIIMLDPRLKEKDETYLRIAQRYQDILTSLDQLNLRKRQVVGTNLMDPEVEEEDELERREFEDKIVKEKREKEDRDRWNYWKSRNDEVGKRLEENEIKSQREIEDKERAEKRSKFDSKMIVRKEKYAQVLEFGEENVPEAIVSEFRNPEEEKAESDSDQEENDEADEDMDNHIIKFQDGTIITLSKEDIEGSTCNSEDKEDSKETRQTLTSKMKLSLKRHRNSFDAESPQNKITKSSTATSEQDTNTQNNSDQLVSSESELIPQNDSPNSGKKRQIIDLDSDDCSEEGSAKLARTDKTLERKIETETEADSETSKGKSGSGTPASNGTRVNELMKKMHNGLGIEYGGSKTEDVNDMQKRCTRIALLMMREELNDLAVSDSHHAHDYFVVNTFKIFCSLKLAETSDARSLESFHSFKVPVDILPLKVPRAKELIHDLKRFALFPKDQVPLEELRGFLKDVEFDELEAVYKWLRDKKEIGATSRQIVSKFKTMTKNRLYRIISLLIEHRLLLRSGVTTARYIHQGFADPWLIHSFKILRRERESLSPIPSGSLFFAEDENKTAGIRDLEGNRIQQTVDDCKSQTHRDKFPPFDKNKEESTAAVNQEDDGLPENQLPEKKTFNEANAEGNYSGVGRRMLRKRTALLQAKDIQKAAKKLDFTTAEAIKVVIKPWIRIDGVLNRRILDRMLGAVLAYCMNHPGIILSKVQRRFMPALQPFHTTELVEMLAKLECLKIKALHKPKVTLFSKPAKTRLNPTTGLDAEDELVLEPEIDASIKFGMFLSNKAYSSDFII